MPSLADIALTVDAAERGHFAAVARSRHVSQSTVSRAVQRVEAALETDLFERRGRSIGVRVEARETVDGLRSIADAWLGLQRTGERETVTRLRIYCTVTASQTIASELLARFRREHPAVVLELRTGPASAALEAARAGDVDAAIAPLPEKLPPSMVSHELAITRLIAIAAIDQPVRSKSWEGAHIIVPSQGVTRQLVDRWRRTSLPATVTVQETDSHEEVVALAALGSGIGIVPKLVVDSSALRPRLRDVTPPSRLPTMRIGLCARRQSARHGALALLWQMLV